MERDYVRELARKVAELAASKKNEEVHKRWRDVNALRKPDRAPVYCRPIACWGELLPESSLQCTDHWLRNLEREFRRVLIKNEIGDDDPVLPYFPVGAAFDCDQMNTWGMEIGKHKPNDSDGAWGYDPPIKTLADFEKLKLPNFSYNDSATQNSLSRAHDLLGDILPIKLECNPPLSATLGTDAADLRGLTEIMMDMIAEPELMHRLMAHLRDGVLQAMQQVAATGLLTENNTGPMTCSDPVGSKLADGKITYKNMWIMANSQEFDQVSPEMWEEFCLNYQMPILEQFGYTAYGCCENLTNKMDGVLSIPNLRIFVCSAWTNLGKLIERVGNDYVIMWRQKASAVVFPDDPEIIKNDLYEGARQLQGCSYQIVLRELQTLSGHLDRLHVWTKYAIEAAEKYA